MKIQSISCDLFYIPLPEVLTDSTHGAMEHFALVTVRIKDNQGLEGLGYTYTVGKTGGAATLAMLEHDIERLLLGEDPNDIDRIFDKLCGGRCTTSDVVELHHLRSPLSISRCGI